MRTPLQFVYIAFPVCKADFKEPVDMGMHIDWLRIQREMRQTYVDGEILGHNGSHAAASLLQPLISPQNIAILYVIPVHNPLFL